MADKNCRHCRGKGYYYIKEDDMEICECDEQEEEEEEESVCGQYPECNNAEGCQGCEHEGEE